MNIDCCIRNNAQADCDVNRHGDLIRLGSKHSQVESHPLPSDCARLCKYGLKLARECGWRDPEEDDLR